MIEFIRSLFKIGDQIFVYRENSEVSGRIVSIHDDFIVLETEDSNIVGVRKSAIESFSRESIHKKQYRNGRSHSSSRPRYHDQVYPRKREFHQYKPGDRVPLEYLAKQDPSLTAAWKRMEAGRKQSSEVRNAIEEEYLEIRDAARAEDQEVVPAHGLIVDLKPSYQFGFIDDMHTGARYFFNKGDIVDSELRDMSDEGIEVVYQRSSNHKGPAAKCVHAPRSVAHLLDIFMELINEDDFVRAKMLLENIQAAYPDNESAQKLMDTLQSVLGQHGHDISSRGDAIYSTARRALENKDYEKALEYYSQCLETGVRKVNAIKEIAQVYISLHAQEKDDTVREEIRQRGLDFIEQYKSELPEGQSTRFSLENIYFALGDYDKHIDVVEDIIQTCGREGELGQYVFYLNKAAQSYMRIEDYDRALDAANQGLEVEPDNTHLLKTKASIEEAQSTGSEADSTEDTMHFD